MQLNTPVEAENKEIEVEPGADSGVQSDAFVEIAELKLVFRGGTLSGEPDIAHVAENSAVQETPYWETGFQVHLQTHVAQLARVIGGDASVDAGPERPGRPSAHAVAAAAIEKPFERQCGRVAVRIAEASEETVDQRAFLSEPKVF